MKVSKILYVKNNSFPIWLWKHEVMQHNETDNSTNFLFPPLESGRRGKTGTCGEG